MPIWQTDWSCWRHYDQIYRYRTSVRIFQHWSMVKGRWCREETCVLWRYWEFWSASDQRSKLYERGRLCYYGIHVWRPLSWKTSGLCNRAYQCDPENIWQRRQCRHPIICGRKNTGIIILYPSDQSRRQSEGSWRFQGCCRQSVSGRSN